MVADLDFVKSKVRSLRERWSVIQAFQNQDTDFGFSDVTMDNIEEKRRQHRGSVESLPSDDAEVKLSNIQKVEKSILIPYFLF